VLKSQTLESIYMAIVKHMPDNTVGPTESAWPGYPRGVWPAVLSAFCIDPSSLNFRHSDCSMPGCACTCHASTHSVGAITWMKWEKRSEAAEDHASTLDAALPDAIGKLDWLVRLGADRDSTRVAPRR
jgi:hypothetical protein